MASIGHASLVEDRVHGLAGVLRSPSPAGRQGLDDVQAAPVLGVAGRVALDRGHAVRGR